MFLSLRTRSGCDIIQYLIKLKDFRFYAILINSDDFHFFPLFYGNYKSISSLLETPQESKASSEVNFQLCCFDDANNRDELERLNHMIVEMESENGCNRLLITRLEDELLAIRKSEMRTVSAFSLNSKLTEINRN